LIFSVANSKNLYNPRTRITPSAFSRSSSPWQECRPGLIILFHTTRVNILILHNTDIPLSPYGGHTQTTVFSLATEAGQEVQQKGRTTIRKSVALIVKGSYLRRHQQLLPPWKQVVKHPETPSPENTPRSQCPRQRCNQPPVVPRRHSRPAGGRASYHRCAVVEHHDGLEDEATFVENFGFSGKRERNVPLHPTVGDKTGRQRRVDIHQISSKDTSGLPMAERRNLPGISPKLVLTRF
jgi:hypothetical protein